MKRFSLLLLAVMLVFTLAACGGGDEEPTPEPAAPTAADTDTEAETAADADTEADTAETDADTDTGEAEAVAVAPSVGDPVTGQQLFSTTCAACHGPAGEGVQGLGKDMTTSEFIGGLSDHELLAFVQVGRPITDPLNTTGVMMPPRGGNPTLTDEQLLDIIAYIRTIHN